MAPAMGMKRPAAAATATQTVTLPAPDAARVAVRDAVRLAVREADAQQQQAPTLPMPTAVVDGVLCLEEVDGRKWSYVVEGGASPGKAGRVSGRGKGRSGCASPMGVTFKAVPLQSPLPPVEEIMSFIRSYVVPEGFPDSVTPSYVPYMTWRALKHFFGGAMGVFTTRTLLNSLGVAQSRATSGAVAINWILKNVAAVTSTSTRTPIYKAYAKGENIGDVTAKGECVGNIADLLGTGLSILISKRNPSLVTSFAFLSCGYLLSSYHEVRSVVLNTLNRARFTVAVDSFIKTGHVPSLKEGNSQETIFNPPWEHQPVSIGSRFGEAFQEPASFVAIRPLFEDERYIVTYNPTKDKVYALLKDQAKPDDILKAAFHAHVLLHFINASHANLNARKRINSNRSYQNPDPLNMDFIPHIAESCKIVTSSYGVFKKKAREQGWIMSESLLNPGRARLCGIVPQ
uniref:Protein root UVB sensitive 6 n=1 Tax=Leersia perrieri TaxID=77586 RepID=A0A0D9WGL9_9ORYZ